MTETRLFPIPRLGECTIDSPMAGQYVIPDDQGVLLDPLVHAGAPDASTREAFECAGPRGKVFLNPGRARAAIVTCGGLCPGLNDVVRGVTMVLWYRYGVRDILGLRYGYRGLVSAFGHTPMQLTPETVEDIHKTGGTVLGSSRGPQAPDAMVDFLIENRIDMLFTVGGDGTQRGALDIANEAARRHARVAVIGIPKTIDNDVSYTHRTFGFETAVALCRPPIESAHMEAKAVQNGVGLVKLMGRESGFVAAYASLASSDVNLVLVPEIPFTVPQVMDFLEARLRRKAHVVIVVAEGAGQELVAAGGADASGNRRLGDIGLYLKDAITQHFADADEPAAVKYIDPSYTIRSAPASADDSVFCFQLAENAVHAAMTGRTCMVVGQWNGRFVHIPTQMAVSARKRIDPGGALWQSVLNNTGQPF